jgi:GNAT superfamily N-acetyltransferase
MDFRTLEHLSLSEITEAFNHAFSDYIIPLRLTEEAMADKMKIENILPELSAGAFYNGKLAGFILHAFDLINGVKTVYNAGTGVIPSHRGKAITNAIYDFIIPKLQSQGIHEHVLEGFNTQRQLGVFKKTGRIQEPVSVTIKEIELTDTLFPAFSSCEPSWQNNTASILRNNNGHQLIAAYDKEVALGYAVYVPSAGRVKQLAVNPAHRRKGIGTALVSYMIQHNQKDALVFTNIDMDYLPGISFFENLGFEKPITQFEMKLIR